MLVAFAPGLFWLWFYLRKDAYGPAPRRLPSGWLVRKRRFDLTRHEMLAPALHQSSALVEHVGPSVRLCDGIPELMAEGELACRPVFAVLQRPGSEGGAEAMQGCV